jgi:hypothetical protein
MPMNSLVERRADNRYPTSLSAKVTTIGKPEPSASGHVSDISKSGVCLNTSLQLSPGDLVQLEMAGSILYGRVAYSTLEGTLFRTGIEVYNVLLGGTDLSDILQTILRQEMPGLPGLERPEVYWG